MALGIQNLPMRQRILLALLLTAAIALFAVGGIGYFYGRDALEEAAYNQLISIRENKKREIEGYFADLQRQLGVLSQGYTTIEAMRGFRQAFDQLKSDGPGALDTGPLQQYYEQEILPRLNENLIQPQQANRFVPRQPLVQRMQHDYIAANPNPTGEKHLLNRAPDRNRPYDQLHERFHPHFRRILNEFDYYDIFLVEPETGHIIYSVFKEVDYFTSLIDGPYAHTNFGRAFRAAAASNDPSKTFLVDFEGYAPSYNAPACFISAPVFDGGTKIGVLIVQVSINAIDRIMTGNRSWRQSGLGESGETYLVGPDFRMRNNSRFLFEDRANFLKQLAVYNVPDTTRKLVERLNTTILQIVVRSPAAQQAVGGVAGLQVVPDYRNVPVLSAFAPVEIPGVRWALLSEIDEAEAFGSARRLRRIFLIVAAGVSLLAIGLAAWLSQGLSLPVLRVRNRLHELARGGLPEKLNIERTDEIGQMNEAANQLIESFEGLVNFAQRIEGGELDASFEPRGPQDVVGTAMVNMRDGLARSRAQEQEALEIALQQEEELRQQTEELRAINEELYRNQQEIQEANLRLRRSEEELEQKVIERTAELKEKTDELLDSIQYARRIQRIILPNIEHIRRYVPDLFVLYRPRDIVSGDFYWFHRHRSQIMLVVADCTGHGVPGAFMSLLGTTALNQIVRDFGLMDVHLLLAELNQRISAILKQGYTPASGEVPPMDGMDISIVSIDLQTYHVQFAGAGRPMYYYHKGQLETLKGDKISIGGTALLAESATYSKQEVRLDAGDQIYLFSDGITDQFNADDTKKVGAKRLREWIELVHHEPLARQQALLNQLMNDWMGNTPQTDDMILMGIKLGKG